LGGGPGGAREAEDEVRAGAHGRQGHCASDQDHQAPEPRCGRPAAPGPAEAAGREQHPGHRGGEHVQGRWQRAALCEPQGPGVGGWQHLRGGGPGRGEATG
ncbi:unnamed protein product, partial [Effrenium voratum]